MRIKALPWNRLKETNKKNIMKDIAIYGAGGFGREVAAVLRKINKKDTCWNFIGFFDDGKEKDTHNEYGTILGGIEELNNWNSELSLIMAIGNPKTVMTLVPKINNKRIDFPNIISPDSLWLDIANVQLGKGNIILCGCIISCNVHFGNFNILNAGVSVGHDASFGNFNSIMPAVHISGYDIIGEGNFLGVSSVILQGIKVNKGVTLGANSVLMRDAKDNSTYLGNPAKVIF